MADGSFRSTFPDRREQLRLSPYEGSKRIIQAFAEAREELKRRGNARPTWTEASKLVGAHTSTLQGSVSHVRAVEVYGISPDLPKQEALRRVNLLDPVAARLASDLDAVQEKRGDIEIMADAISNLIIRAGKELPRLDAGALAAYLRRDPAKRGATRSALIDLQRWYTTLEQALDSPLK